MESFLARNARLATVVLGLAMLAVLIPASAQGQTFTTLYAFTGATDGAYPYAPLALDKAGNLYGTASRGGLTGGCGNLGCGTVFKLDSTNTLSVLYTFTGPDGTSPTAGLLRDKAGNLWGTTNNGGRKGLGAAFHIKATGQEIVVHSFGATKTDGTLAYGGLIADSAGNHYGLTYTGGTGGVSCGVLGCGTVYKVDKTGKETVLYSFTGATDGGGPYYGNLVRDAAGNLYGTNGFGGSLSNCSVGCGVVFKVDSTGHESVLYAFTGGADGANPRGGLVRDSAGNLYGTTYDGGIPGGCIFGYGCGTVFKLDTSGNLTTLYSFTGGSDGGNSFATLVRDAAGNLYGTTYAGAFGYGTIFKLDSAGNETTLYQFTDTTDGAFPIAGLVRDAAGNLYGTTAGGGGASACTGGCGTVFKLTP